MLQYLRRALTASTRTQLYKLLGDAAELLATRDAVNGIIDWLEGQASLMAATTTALSAIDASLLPDGSTAYVLSLDTYSSGGTLCAFTQTILGGTSASGGAEAIIAVTPDVALPEIEIQWAFSVIDAQFAHIGGAAKQETTLIVEEATLAE